MPSSGVQKSALDRKSTRLNSSHGSISYAVFCLIKKEHCSTVHTGGTTHCSPDTSTQQPITAPACLHRPPSPAVGRVRPACTGSVSFFLSTAPPPNSTTPPSPHPLPL